MPYAGWETERINDAILQGVRPYKPDEAAKLGLVDELWRLLQRCWEERREARPDLQTVRTCLGDVAPLWHVRADLPSIVDDDDDTDSLYTGSNHSLTYSPVHSPTPRAASLPPSPLP